MISKIHPHIFFYFRNWWFTSTATNLSKIICKTYKNTEHSHLSLKIINGPLSRSQAYRWHPRDTFEDHVLIYFRLQNIFIKITLILHKRVLMVPTTKLKTKTSGACYCLITRPHRWNQLQVMAWCLVVPCYYLNQCWLLIKGILWHSTDSNFIRNDDELNSHHVLET